MSLLFSFRLYSYGLTFSRLLLSRSLCSRKFRCSSFSARFCESRISSLKSCSVSWITLSPQWINMTVRHCEEAVFFYSYQSWPLFDQLHSNCKLPLTPVCLTTCCCLATFLFSDVKQTVFALLPGNWTETFIDIFFARFHAALATVGRAGRGFGTTDLLTSLREELISNFQSTIFP